MTFFHHLPSPRKMGCKRWVRPWKPLWFFPCWVAAATSWICLEGDWCSLLKRWMLWWQHFGCDSLPRANFGLTGGTVAFHWVSGRDDSVPVEDHASTDGMFLCEETWDGHRWSLTECCQMFPKVKSTYREVHWYSMEHQEEVTVSAL